MLIYRVVYVREGAGNARNILVCNVPFVKLFRSNYGALRSGFSVLRGPMSSKGTSSGVESDGVCILSKDGSNLPLNNINRRALAVLIIQNKCKCLVLTT
jgi:hypothetical protein